MFFVRANYAACRAIVGSQAAEHKALECLTTLRRLRPRPKMAPEAWMLHNSVIGQNLSFRYKAVISRALVVWALRGPSSPLASTPAPANEKAEHADLG